MLSGRTPFSGETPVAIAYQHVSSTVPPITSIDSSLDLSLNEFFAVALAKNPKDRYQSAGAMLKDLKRLSRGEKITTQIPRTRPRISGRNRIAILATLVIALAGTTGYILFGSSSSSLVAVPNVVGLTEPQARAQLSGFTITIQRAHDPRIPQDRVASQIPLATEKVAKGSAITLTLSDGPGDATVPTGLVGKPLEEVRSLLSVAGLLISKITPVDSDQEPGIVLKVTPDQGSTIVAGSGIELEIASGNVAVPSLVGKSDIEAKTLLTQAGFLVRVVEAFDANQQLGIVLAQAPAPGEVKFIGSSVTITVNTKPAGN